MSAIRSGASGRLAGPASPPEAPTDASRAMDSLRRIVHALRVATRASEREFGLTAAQLFVLRQLSAAPGQSLSNLALRTRTTQSSISEVVARLVQRGLVSRESSKQDRRRAELSLTAASQALLANAPETIQERLLRGFDRLDDKVRTALADHLESWLVASGLESVAPALFFEASVRPGDADGVELSR